MSDLLRALNVAFSTAHATSDGELLRRFATARDEDAFELLVRRHADLVWKVCRGILRDDRQAAEDAFQAAFLALARHAGVVGRESVGGWLFRVARHAALKARRRRPAEPLPESVPAAGKPPDDAAAAGELAGVLAEEVGRLAAKFREPVLLCFYQGHTHAEAAAKLGWAVGTVASRVARAKDRLRRQLLRRGVALSAAGLTGGLSAESATALPPGLVRQAVACAAGRAVPGSVLTLAEGAMSSMRTVHRAGAAVAAALMIGLAGGTMLTAGGGAEPPPAKAPPAGKAPPKAEAKPADKRITADPLVRAYTRRGLVQVAEAIRAYAREHGHLPTDIHDPQTGKPILSWRVAVLPYMEQKALYNLFKLDQPWDSEANKMPASAWIKAYAGGITPAGGGYGLTRVRRPVGPGTLFESGNRIPLPNDLPAKWRYTLLVVEAGDPVAWAKPDDLPFDPKNPPRLDGPYSNVVLAAPLTPGTGWSLRPDLTPDEVRKLALRDGEFPSADFERCRLAAGPDSPEYQTAIDDYRFLMDQLTRAREIQVRLQAEEIKRAGRGRRADDAADVGFQALEVGEKFAELLKEVSRNPALTDDDRKEIEKLVQELAVRTVERQKKEKK